MKKYLFLNAFILIILCLLLTGCMPVESEYDLDVKSLKIHEVSPKVFAIDEGIDLSQVWIVAELQNGELREIPLSDTMINDKDRVKFSSPTASATILIHYGKKSVPFEFSVIESRYMQEYRVQFESNGGTKVENVYTNLIESFYMPDKEGYNFKGWFDNVECVGNKIEVPYEVNENKIFYAKWVDNRSYTVEFWDRIGNVVATQEIVHGEDILVFPEVPEEAGWIFTRKWSGQTENITSNLHIQALYEKIKLKIVFSCENDYAEESILYGDKFDFQQYVTRSDGKFPAFPQKEGYTGNWYIQRDDDSLAPIYNRNGTFISEEFERVTKNILIVPHYERIMYTITFKCDEYFSNPWSSLTKTVEYGGDLVLSATDNVEISTPKNELGHTASWAVKIDDDWINIENGSIWDSIEREWGTANGGAEIEYRRDGDILAIITENGNKILNIKSDITLEAKYLRNTYNLIFRATERGASEDLCTIPNIKYGTKFSLYNLTNNSSDDVQYSSMSKVDFVRYKCINDWDISWHKSRSFDENEKFEFENGNYIIIDESIIDAKNSGKTTIFYAKDIDKRVYNVRFYDWDFVNKESILISVRLANGEEVDEQIVPFGASPEIVPTLNNKVEFGYELLHPSNHWHDAPQDKAYAERIQPSYINKDMDFYARYEIRQFSVVFEDMYYPYSNEDYFKVIPNLPSPTYIDEYGNDLNVGYLLMRASYTRSFGDIITDQEIYFGGSSVYENKLFMDNYNGEMLNKYNSINVTKIKEDIETFRDLIEKIKGYERAVLNYTTNSESEAFYAEHKPRYNEYRQELYDLSKLLDFYNDYKIQSYQEGDDIPSGLDVGDAIANTGNYEKLYLRLRYGKRGIDGQFIDGEYCLDENNNFVDNGDYERYSNLFYNTLNRPGFVFDGWYSDASFHIDYRVSSPNDANILIMSLSIKDNVTLYAKWIDLEKGSDGLVFQLYDETIGGETHSYYEIIDYLTEEQFINEYQIINIDGIDYYQNIGKGLLIKARDLSHNFLPQEGNLSKEVRLPSVHKGISVLRIANTLFATNGLNGVRTIDISKRIEFVEESTFSKCAILELITIDEENIHFMINKGVMYSQDGSVLICYPAKNTIDAYTYGAITVNPSTFIIPSSVQRIASGAFVACNQLLYIAFEEGHLELTIGRKAFSGVSKLIAIGMLKEEDGCYIANAIIPDRLINIESLAFDGCWGLSEVMASDDSRLMYVGKDALTFTKWYRNKTNDNTFYVDGEPSNGIIVLGYVALGIINNFIGGEVVLRDQIKAIANGAFEGKDKITSIKIGENNSQITYIGEQAFYKCTLLENVYLYLQEPEQCEIGDNVFGGVGGSFSIFVPNIDGIIDMFLQAEGWAYYAELEYIKFMD